MKKVSGDWILSYIALASTTHCWISILARETCTQICGNIQYPGQEFDDHPCALLHLRQGHRKQVGRIPGPPSRRLHWTWSPRRTVPFAVLLPADAPNTRRPHRKALTVQRLRTKNQPVISWNAMSVAGTPRVNKRTFWEFKLNVASDYRLFRGRK